MSGKGKPAAYKLLGLDPVLTSQQPIVGDQVDQFLSRLPAADGFAMSRDPFYYLQLSDANEAMRITKRYLESPEWARQCLPVEAYCLAVEVPTLRVLEIIFDTATRLAQQHTRVAQILAHQATPDVVRKSIAEAKKNDGFADRQLLFKTTGLLPTPRGPSVRVNVNQSNQVAQVVPAPPPEQTIRRLVDRFNENRPQLAEAREAPDEFESTDV